MSARGLLVLGLALLLSAWAASGSGLLRQAPAFLRFVAGVIFIYGSVRVGLSIAIIAFDLAPASLLLPIAFGVLAWWLRPGRPARP